MLETAEKSLRHSCRSELTTRISLPWDRYSYGRRLLGLRNDLHRINLQHRTASDLYIHLRVSRACLINSLLPGLYRLWLPNKVFFIQVTVFCGVPSTSFSQAPKYTLLIHLCPFEYGLMMELFLRLFRGKFNPLRTATQICHYHLVKEY